MLFGLDARQDGTPNMEPKAQTEAAGIVKERLWKFLVVVDDTPEFRAALRFACLRAARIKGGVLLLYVIPPGDFQQWAAVEQIMREEAREEAQLVLDRFAAKVREIANVTPETVIREGKLQEEILMQIDDDPDIHVLVLGAATGDNPGPLVRAFSGPLLSSLHVPVVIVPGNLSDDAIDRLV